LKILIATSDVPFVEGGHRVIARSLQQAFREAGHSCEILTTPQNRFGRQFSAYLATRLTDVELTGTGEKVDRLVSLRFPSYALKHPNHVCWLNHRMREYYDLWKFWSSELSVPARWKERIRYRWIHAADRYFLKKNVRKVFAQSKNIQDGLMQWGKIKSDVLYPPAPPRKYRNEQYGDFIFCPARLNSLKRVSLLVEALAQTKNARAKIAGDGSEKERIEWLIAKNNLKSRVELLGHVSEDQLVELYSRCRAVFYAPIQEDFGLVTVEAFASGKPVLTATDSGGPTELVQHQINGFVVNPDPASVANAITNLFDDPSSAEKLGNTALQFSKSITWPNTVTRLLE
jgi:glycosyltransferase involved in cell wall biosynthesis